MAYQHDDLNEIIEAPVRKPEGATINLVGFVEQCPKCYGSGNFITPRGRVLGPCFACNGNGSKTFKTAPRIRAENRVAAAKRRALSAADNWTRFAHDKPESATWIESSKERFEFAAAMYEAVRKYGALTERQQAAVDRSVARLQQSKEDAVARREQAAEIDASPVQAAFDKASGALRRPTLTLAGMIISKAPQNGRNAGALYVKGLSDDKGDLAYLGKIQDGKFFRSRDCSPAREVELRAVLADPKEAAVRYGRMTGNCAVCNRHLSDPASVERGIGPICAERFGW